MKGKQVFLWSAPRCVSTAFERSVRTLRDVEVFHESFAIPFHHGPERDSDLFTDIPLDSTATYQSVADILKQDYEGKQLVFAKEMACCLKKNYDLLLQDGMKDYQHTFLIRNPYEVARSLINCGYFVAKEFGIKELYELYNFIVEKLQPCPVVIDAADLLDSPDETMRAYCQAIGIEYEVGMTTWQPGPVPGWDREVCAGWHDSVMTSSGIVRRSRRSKAPEVDDLPKEAVRVAEECMPCYEAMYAKRMVWEYAFDQLRVLSSEYPVMLTEAPLNPKRNRERMIQLMFETFNVPCVYVAVQAVMALYACGRTTGVVFDCGDGVSHTVPVYEGYMLPFATQRINLAGRDITEYLQRLVTERGYSFKTSAEHQIIRNVKEKLCYVAQDFDKELEASETSDECEALYTLPDGHSLRIGNERFRAPEALFQPCLLGQDIDGIHESIYKCVKKCDIDIRCDLFHNILLSGGTTLLPGFSSRLHKEIYTFINQSEPNRVRIVNPEDRQYSVWCGSAVLAGLPTFQQMCISSQEYDEHGPEIVHRKCF